MVGRYLSPERPCLTGARCSLGFIWLFFSHTVLAAELTEADFLGGGDVTVLTSSRLAQPVMDSPNATTVLDRATIEASGYQNISDLFRLVPGLHVGQSNGWFHTVSRTFADAYSRRMQVLIDGRSVYMPSTGGVRWDSLPLSVEDIERIEVVRGSNAASHGANAFTGIINIITRHPEDVLGKRLNIVIGSHDHQEGWFSWAGQGESSSHRITLGHRENGGFSLIHDDERSEILSYRGHFDLSGRHVLGLQAGVVQGSRGLGKAGDVNDLPHSQDVDSMYMQADYRISLAEDREWITKFYFNHHEQHERVPTDLLPFPTFYDIDLKSQRWHLEGQYSTVLSADVRALLGGYVRREGVQSPFYYGVPDHIRVDSKGLFGHVEWRIGQEWLLNVGTFWEDYDLVGAKTSPRIALNWQPLPNHTIRFGVSKGYRNPVVFESRANMNATLLDANGGVIAVLGPINITLGPIAPEQLISREISYLGSWPDRGIALDLRVFHENIDDFINFPGGVATNLGSITHRGAEAQFKWQPQPGSQVIANYAYLKIDTQNNENDYSPSHIAGVHFMHAFPNHIDLTLSHYWTSRFRPLGEGALPSTRRWDARIAKRFNMGSSRGQIALGVQNLGGDYQEFKNEPENRFDTRTYLQLKFDL